jgi:hypothetical protein
MDKIERDAPTAWRLTLMLADSAQAVQGKLYVLGGGWTHTGPQPTPFAIAAIVNVPWAETNRRHMLKLQLVTSDGKPFLVPTPAGEQPLEIKAEFEVGRPPGITPGTPLAMPFAVNLGPLMLTPGRYEWRCSINDASNEDWKLPFEFRAAMPPFQISQ